MKGWKAVIVETRREKLDIIDGGEGINGAERAGGNGEIARSGEIYY